MYDDGRNTEGGNPTDKRGGHQTKGAQMGKDKPWGTKGVNPTQLV